MEADGKRSVGTSSDSHDGEPAAVRRRVDLEGNFIATDRNTKDNSASDQRGNERTAVMSPAKENDDSWSDESLLEVTLTSQQDFHTSSSVVDASCSGLYKNISKCDSVIHSIEEVMKVSQDHTADKFDCITLNTASTGTTASEILSKEGELSPSASYISPRKSTWKINQQKSNVVACNTGQWKIDKETRNCRSNKNEDGSKDSIETDVSCTNSTSGGSSSGFYGDIDEAEYTGSLASSVDLVEMYENAMVEVETEELREEDFADVLSSCLENVSSKIGHLQETATEVLRSYCVRDDEAGIYKWFEGSNSSKDSSSSEVRLCGATTGIPSSHRTPNDISGNSDINGSTSDSLSISSEGSDSCDQRFVLVRDYVLSVKSVHGCVTENSGDMEDQQRAVCNVDEDREASAASRGTSPSTSEDDRTSSKAQSGTSEEAASNKRQVGGERATDTDQENYAKQLRNTCKSARVSRRIVSRQQETISQIQAVAEQRVSKMYVTCLTILNCVKGTMIVVSNALDAKQVAQKCLQEAIARASVTVFNVADAATSTALFSREALIFSEWTVELHKEAVKALRAAETSWDEINVEEERARDISRQVSDFGNEVVKIIQDTSCMSLEALNEKKCVAESSRGTLSVALKEVKGRNSALENLSHRCDRILSKIMWAMQRATIASAKAIDEAQKALQTFKSGEFCVPCEDIAFTS